MSCHEIGRGMNYVGDTVLNLFDAGEMKVDTARKILEATIKGVNYCDGNDDEAYETYGNCRCGYCLKQVPKSEFLLDIYELSKTYSFKVLENAHMGTNRLCKDCLTKLFDSLKPDLHTEFADVSELLEYVKENVEEDLQLSTTF